MRFKQNIPKYLRSRSKGINDGIVRKYDEKVYRENIHAHICYDLYKKTPSCNQCKQKETLMDLHVIKDTSYQLSERIIGHLDVY